MVNKCVAHGCKTGYASENADDNYIAKSEDTNISTFHFPNERKYPELRAKWVRWVNRKDFTFATDSNVICEKHFDERFISRGKKCRLNMKMNPMPTIYSIDSLKRPSVLPTPDPLPRKIPKIRGIYEDELKDFNETDNIADFHMLDEKHAPSGFLTKKDDQCIIFYRLKFDATTSFPKIFESIRIDTDLHVQLQYNGVKVPLPDWFVVGRNAKLKRLSMLENFTPYLKKVAEETSGDDGKTILSELEERKHFKAKGRPPYSASMIRYALLLRYTSAQAYKILLEQFPLPSISLLNKIQQGGVDAIKALKLLREQGNISKDLVLMADEMYLQKRAEYSGGEYIGADEDDELYKGVVAFMVVGMKESTPYVIKASPEVTIKGPWLSKQIDECITLLGDNGFTIRSVVTDNHSTNVNAFVELRKTYKSPSEYFFIHPKNHGKKTYLFYDNVHLLKNIRNNLLNRKKFVFPEIDFSIGETTIKSPAGYLSWSDLHCLHELDSKLKAKLRKAPRLNRQTLHPGNDKQDVQRVLAIFHETTIAAFKSHLPNREDCVGFLSLINTWWLIVNSKERFHVNKLGDAIKPGDGKLKFMREFGDWVEFWSLCPNYTLTAQTSSALVTTLRAQEMLVEELVDEGYHFVLLGRLQTDPLERRFSKYRQMSGGRFLVSLREVQNSDRILACRSLIKANINFWKEDITPIDTSKVTIPFIESVNVNSDSIMGSSLDPDSAEVATTIAGYIAKKLTKRFKCNDCSFMLSSCDTVIENNRYLATLSRGGLTVPSQVLADYTCGCFAALDYCEERLKTEKEEARKSSEYILNALYQNSEFTCKLHKEQGFKFAARIIVNVFFNNKRKLANSNLKRDEITSFKARQTRKE